MASTRKWVVGLAAVGGMIASGTATVFADGTVGGTPSVTREATDAPQPSAQELEQQLQSLRQQEQAVSGEVQSARDRLNSEIASAEATLAVEEQQSESTPVSAAPATASAPGPTTTDPAAASPPSTEPPEPSTEPPTATEPGDGTSGSHGGGDSGGDN